MSPAETVGALLARATRTLAEAGVAEARLDARLLVGHALDLSREAMFAYPEAGIGAAAADRAWALIRRRAAREPVSHILGRKGFWTLELAVGPDILAPRPDSETVVEAVLASARPGRILDLGTGSGCLLLALLSEWKEATGIGVDRNPGALRVAAANAAATGLADRAAFVAGSWGAVLTGRFDVIVSNPPYIPTADIAGLDPEVARYEPRLALDGGADGLDCYRALLPDMARLLAPGGLAALEVGAGQAADVAALAEAAGLAVVELRRDLAGIERCVVARRPS
jgi:release factor glutamine methyltransferase